MDYVDYQKYPRIYFQEIKTLIMRKLYCFDFDGTITTKDTMFLFLKFCAPFKFYIRFIQYAPLFILVKLHFANAEQVKRSFIASILQGYSEEQLQKYSKKFHQEYKNQIIRSKAVEFFKTIDTNAEAFLVTASLDIWVKPFADEFGFGCIATRAMYERGIFTGKFATKNCNGKEKVNRIKAEIDTQTYGKRIAFGDTSGDKEMLAWADEGFYRFFH